MLYRWGIRNLYEKLIGDPERLDWFCANVVTDAWHFQHDAGRSFAETSAELIAQYPDERELIEAFHTRWLETVPGPVPGMIELVDELAAADVPLYAITNFSDEFWAMFRPTAPVFRHFGDIVVSGTEKMMKPDAAIFELAMRRFGLRTGEAVFVDDRADNVAAGERAGLVGHVFCDAGTLRAELTRLGPL